MDGIVTFLNEKKNLINREARISTYEDRYNRRTCYNVANLNMPYLGTISEAWSKDTLNRKIKNKEISVKWNTNNN